MPVGETAHETHEQHERGNAPIARPHHFKIAGSVVMFVSFHLFGGALEDEYDSRTRTIS